jgi:hypothetical protein
VRAGSAWAALGQRQGAHPLLTLMLVMGVGLVHKTQQEQRTCEPPVINTVRPVRFFFTATNAVEVESAMGAASSSAATEKTTRRRIKPPFAEVNTGCRWWNLVDAVTRAQDCWGLAQRRRIPRGDVGASKLLDSSIFKDVV